MKRKMTIFASGLSVFAMVLALALLAGSVSEAHAATFTVNSTADAVDAAPGDGVCATAGGVCTLRAAIQEANALAGDDIITVPAGTYTLTIAGTGENAAATGDLDITSNITINGAGAGTSIIDGGALDRVFHVTGAFTVSISGVTVRNGNVSGNGGGIWNYGGTLTITNSTFSGNSASLDGGGILSWGTLTVTDSTFSGNSAGAGGGGIYDSGGTTTITNSTFSGNSTGTGGGGGIQTQFAVTITSSTFSGNSTAFSDGGGIYINSGTLTITNSTVSGNSASLGTGGGIYNYAGGGGTVTLRNTIVANSTSGGNCGGTITNGGNNIDGGTTCGWDSVSGSMSNTDPLLGSLANNGGPTQTHALLAGSPAIDGLTFNPPNQCPATDQRGILRPQGVRYDIGAYEYQPQQQPQQQVSVPTMTEWGMIIFMVLAALGSIRYLRRLKRV